MKREEEQEEEVTPEGSAFLQMAPFNNLELRDSEGNRSKRQLLHPRSHTIGATMFGLILAS